MSNIIRIAVFSALAVMVSAMVFWWTVSRIRYRIGSKHVRVNLFGVTIRRISIESIESVSKRRGNGLAEHWWSTFKPKHRMLVLRRWRGICRDFVITPKNRYVFKTDLERAMRRHKSRSSAPPEPSSEGDSEQPTAEPASHSASGSE
jgi:hypothetical protein